MLVSVYNYELQNEISAGCPCVENKIENVLSSLIVILYTDWLLSTLYCALIGCCLAFAVHQELRSIPALS